LEDKPPRRTVKKLFLTANRVSKRVKSFSGYVGLFIIGAALTYALDSKKENGDNEESEYSEGNNE